MKYVLCLFAALFSLSSFAADMGFRFQNGKCVNDNGTEGLNPSYFGQCGDNRGITLYKFDLTGSDLSGSTFDGADLQLTIFNKTTLTNVSFNETNLAGVQFLEATLESTNFNKAILANTK